ncbi:MAG: flagellar filament capping protein FliD [Defluviitaleaceae bacterium]|nr:flagellar filament capping protein FliD [Defluviitaleaceae bacterium]
MSLLTNQMRFTGLSGIDTDSMVRQIMNAESMRMHSFQRNRQILQWRQQDLRGVSNQLRAFQDRFLGVNTGPDAVSLRMQSVMNSRAVNVNGNGLDVTAGANAQTGNFSVNVIQESTTNRMTGARQTVAATAPNQLDFNNIQDGQTIRLALNNGTAHEINLEQIRDASNSNAEFVTNLNAQLKARFGEDVTSGENRIEASLTSDGRLSFDTNGAGNTLTLTNGAANGLGAIGGFTSGTRNNFSTAMTVSSFFEAAYNRDGGPRFGISEEAITINGVSIAISGSQTIQEMMTAVNNSGAGVTLSFNNLTNSFSMVSRTAGEEGNIQIGGGRTIPDPNDPSSVSTPMPDNGTAFMRGLGLDSSIAGSNNVSGQNAVVEITTSDGNSFKIDRPSNTFNLMNEIGINFTISSEAVGNTISFNVTRNTDRTRDIITSFVEEYNALVRELHELRNTARPRGSNGSLFDPLLDHEREGLSDSEIRNWEDQARRGHLHRSQEIESALTQMRRRLSEGIQMEDGSRMHLFHFGISTERSGSLTTLTIDEDRLSTAINTMDESTVHSFFSSMAENLNTAMSTATERIRRVAGTQATSVNTQLQGRIDDIDRRVSTMETRLRQREQALFAQFARMESAVMQANSQMEFLFMMAGQ